MLKLAIDTVLLTTGCCESMDDQSELRREPGVSPSQPLPSAETEEQAQSTDSENDRTHAFEGSGESAAEVVHETIGRYRIKGTLGAGGFGRVYRTWDDQLQREVAIKVLLCQDGLPAAGRLLTEARMLAKLDHPGIVPVYDVGRTPHGELFIVSKFVEGRDLAQWIQNSRPSYRDAARLIRQIAEALAYAHRQGVVHRDVKPANILVSADSQPVLADFGLAIADSDYGRGSRFVGTPAYMSPEQARHEGHRVDGRSDVYSLGVVFYELLTGRRPFHAHTRPELLDCIRNVEVRPPRQIDPRIPRELERICLKTLTKRAAERYNTAGDLAEELRIWETGQGDVATASHTPAPQSESAISEHPSRVMIVPRGLRSFESSDADFFLHLIPGPRDRDGLPDCVHFWKSRIEAVDPDTAFRVGLLLGPSGCGKSSLVQAGIVPHLDERILVVAAEARGEGLEAALLQRIQRRLPALEGTADLAEALALVRQQRALPAGRKLLIVIDQFEQWLSANEGIAATPLIEALRQCDGAAVQTLLLLRDDFTLAAARFLEELEEPIQQNRNFATVDLFGVEHARRVLAAFGRSYGRVGEQLSTDEQRFVAEAVDELARGGRVIPIQLAVFAEMVKDQPWLPTTLRQMGGLEGIGVAFLEERLTGLSAHPSIKSQLPLVRRLLSALLPEAGAAIKGRAKSRTELLREMPDGTDDASLDQLLHLLDSEVRLLTPAGGDASASHDSTSSQREPNYQLAHDYLVPAIRSWLTAEDRRTRAGRAYVRLSELAESWNRRPERRRLPTLFEWLAIRTLTQPRDWTNSQRRMMQAADRRIATGSAVALVTLLVLLLAGWQWNGRMRAAALRDQVLDADPRNLPEVLARTPRYARWLTPLLDSAYAREFAEQPGEAGQTDQQFQRRLNLTLATWNRHPQRFQFVRDHVDRIRPAHLATVRQLLPPHRDDVPRELWQRLEAAVQNHSPTLLPLACLLAETFPADEARWREFSPDIATALVDTRPSEFSLWLSLLAPLQPVLVTPLLDRWSIESEVSPAQRRQLLEAIMACSAGQPATLVTAAERAEFPELLSLLYRDKDRFREAANLLRRRFHDNVDRLSESSGKLSQDRPTNGTGMQEVSWAALPDSLVQTLERYDGLAAADWCLVTSLPLEEFDELAAALGEHQFRPSSFRPYRRDGSLLVAASWTRDGRAWQRRHDLSAEELLAAERQLQDAGLQIADFARYSPASEMAASSGGPDVEQRYAALWLAPENAQQETRFYCSLPHAEHEQRLEEWTASGFILQRVEIHVQRASQIVATAVWTRSAAEGGGGVVHEVRDARAFGDLYPGRTQSDLRMEWLPIDRRDPLALELTANVFRVQAQRERDPAVARTKKFTLARYQIALGEFDAALAALDEIAQRTTSRQVVERRTTVLAHLGKKQDFDESLAAYRKLAGDTIEGAVLGLRGAVLAGNRELAAAELARLEQKLDGPGSSLDDLRSLARAYGAVSRLWEQEPGDERGTAVRRRGLEWLRKCLVHRQMDVPSALLNDVDFDSLRVQPEYRQLVAELGLDRRFSAAWCDRPEFETQSLIALEPDRHLAASRKLRQAGYRAICIQAAASPAGTPVLVCSLWERRRLDPSVAIQVARRNARLALLLASVGETDLLSDGLREAWGRELRSQLVEGAPVVLDPAKLVQLFRQADSQVLQRHLLLALGGVAEESFQVTDREYLQSRVGRLLNESPESSVQAAAAWCARQWGSDTPALSATRSEPAADTNWYTNRLGNVMVVISPPERFLMGAPPSEPDRELHETPHWMRFSRRYSLSATEVTVAEFNAFLRDPQVQKFYAGHAFQSSVTDSGGNVPQASVRWYDAIRFCQWLSEQEQIPESDWCYPDIWKVNDGSFRLPPDYLHRRGYRLPTEAEWEFACRAGSNHSRPFGDDERLLPSHAWFQVNSGSQLHPVGWLKPNDLGLFDMLGNVHEWCLEPYDAYRTPLATAYRLDDEDGRSLTTALAEERIVRGGSIRSPASDLRSANRWRNPPRYNSTTTGFRIARTESWSE